MPGALWLWRWLLVSLEGGREVEAPSGVGAVADAFPSELVAFASYSLSGEADVFAECRGVNELAGVDGVRFGE